MTELDDIDRTILARLQDNGRTTYAEIGLAVGLAASSVNDRIRKLQERGAIEGIHAVLSAPALRLDLLAFIFVGWNDPATEKVFLERVAADSAVLECHHVTGSWNYLVKVRTPTTRELESFLNSIVKSVPGVLRTETLIALSSAKETHRLPVAKDW